MSTVTDLGLTLPSSTDKVDVETQISGNFQIIEDELAKKQETLTAGDNITIEDNVISAASTDLSNYYTKTEVDAAITSAVGDVSSVLDTINGEEV